MQQAFRKATISYGEAKHNWKKYIVCSHLPSLPASHIINFQDPPTDSLVEIKTDSQPGGERKVSRNQGDKLLLLLQNS